MTPAEAFMLVCLGVMAGAALACCVFARSGVRR
jgi:hypothetical protein